MVTKYGKNVKFIAGGATQNSIRVIQWILKQHNVCSYMGCVGDDADGRRMAEIAHADGVNVLYMITKEEKTGTCAVCVSDAGKKRSLCAYLGAANKFKKDHVLKHWDAVEKAKIFYSSGFHLTVSPDSMLEMAKHASQHAEKTYVLNIGAPFIPEFFSDALLSVLPYTDILFGNETEAQAFAKNQKWSESLTIREIAIQISKIPKANQKDRLVIITQGADDVIVVKRTANGHEHVRKYAYHDRNKSFCAVEHGNNSILLLLFLDLRDRFMPFQYLTWSRKRLSTQTVLGMRLSADFCRS